MPSRYAVFTLILRPVLLSVNFLNPSKEILLRVLTPLSYNLAKSYFIIVLPQK